MKLVESQEKMLLQVSQTLFELVDVPTTLIL